MTDADRPRVFLGWCARRPWAPPATWDLEQRTGVDLVCSVSSCLVKPPEGWVDRWDFNQATCYNDEATAWAAVPAEEREEHTLFAYWLCGVTLDGQDHERIVRPEDVFSPDLPPLPGAVQAEGYQRIGHDVVALDRDLLGFGCSPLSCNLLAQQIRVNRHCLLDDVETALHVAQRFDREQPEPGNYYVVEVAIVP